MLSGTSTPVGGGGGAGIGGPASRFDSSFYRSHDAMSAIPSDAQSVRSQATYSSGLPTFSQAGYPASMKRGGAGGVGVAGTYASSTFSQDLLSSADGASEYKSQAGWTNDDDARTTYTASNLTDY
ncbi:uncharacterized protein RHOBADRAFT_64796 [Rhodotorula graminis WP1]|uniref:Uncharacterized protein n=1 Tax=Rhodotorula graminis (strain WP1) TaxID=578459 RepID=A0A194S4U8_RHOGW|nr:uncharacterized protein RHOBADRAFT_64796 [Rhodotorula graminis WP1]KPV75612.1 hypothetical protein RHOBADRAFT_64796 [Rhodotorula graminis WP1]